MQISSGWAKGLKLAVPAGEATRPTSAKVRAAIVNMLQPYLEDALFLDLFAGSGAMGIEAVSRGGRGAVFVEQAGPAVSCLKKNVAELERRAQAQGLELPVLDIVARDAAAAVERLGRHGAFDLIYLDPPYARAADHLEALGPRLAALAAPEGMMVVESAAEDGDRIEAMATGVPGFGWVLVKRKEYGDTMVTMWERSSSSS